MDQPLLVMSRIPYLGPVGQHWDDKCIIDLSPIEEIEASLCVAQDVNPAYGRVILNVSDM
jgi:hypothetical protein